MTNATMTASLTPAYASPTFGPSRDLPVALGLGNGLPSACSRFCVGLAGWADNRWRRNAGLLDRCPARALRGIPSPQSRIANMAEACALWFAFTPTVAVLSYLAASCAFPLQDVMMERLDRAIGFDWSAWHDAVLDRPILSCLLLVAYSSLFRRPFFRSSTFPQRTDPHASESCCYWRARHRQRQC